MSQDNETFDPFDGLRYEEPNTFRRNEARRRRQVRRSELRTAAEPPSPETDPLVSAVGHGYAIVVRHRNGRLTDDLIEAAELGDLAEACRCEGIDPELKRRLSRMILDRVDNLELALQVLNWKVLTEEDTASLRGNLFALESDFELLFSHHSELGSENRGSAWMRLTEMAESDEQLKKVFRNLSRIPANVREHVLRRIIAKATDTDFLQHIAETAFKNPQERTPLVLRMCELAETLVDWIRIRQVASPQGEIRLLAMQRILSLARTLEDWSAVYWNEPEDTELSRMAADKMIEMLDSLDGLIHLVGHYIPKSAGTVPMRRLAAAKACDMARTFDERLKLVDGGLQKLDEPVFTRLLELAESFDDLVRLYNRCSSVAEERGEQLRMLILERMSQIGTMEDWSRVLRNMHFRHTNYALDRLAHIDAPDLGNVPQQDGRTVAVWPEENQNEIAGIAFD